MAQAAENICFRREIIEIDENLCDGCGLCLTGCAEGALALVNGKAKLVNDVYCDGLGACLGRCPQGALKIISRAAAPFDEAAALAQAAGKQPGPGEAAGGCPGGVARLLGGPNGAVDGETPAGRLLNWPLQLMLAPPSAEFFNNRRLVLAADCSGFSLTDLHKRFLDGQTPLVIACPKLDDKTDIYLDKLALIMKNNPRLQEVTVLMMTVPCCCGLGYLAGRAREKSGRDNLKIRLVYLNPDSKIEREEIA